MTCSSADEFCLEEMKDASAVLPSWQRVGIIRSIYVGGRSRLKLACVSVLSNSVTVVFGLQPLICVILKNVKHSKNLEIHFLYDGQYTSGIRSQNEWVCT